MPKLSGSLELGQCYRCAFTEACEHGQVDQSKCAVGLVKERISKEDFSNFEIDANREGYAAAGVEDYNCLFNQHDWIVDVYDSGHYVQSLRRIISESGKLVPLKFDKKVMSKFGLRESEFGCTIAKIISKIDKSKLPFKVEPSPVTKAGIVTHTLFNQQHVRDYVHNQTLLEVGIEPIPRQRYCEKTVQRSLDDIIPGASIRGHYDAGFEFEGSSDVLIADLKRARHGVYQKKSHRRQLLGYNLSTAEMLALHPKWFYFITIERPFHRMRGVYRAPSYHFTKLRNDPGEPVLKKLNKNLKESYFDQARILSSRKEFFSERAKREKAVKGCINYSIEPPKPCFNLEDGTCNFLVREMQASSGTLADLLDDLKVLPKDLELPSL